MLRCVDGRGHVAGEVDGALHTNPLPNGVGELGLGQLTHWRFMALRSAHGHHGDFLTEGEHLVGHLAVGEGAHFDDRASQFFLHA